MHGHSLFCFLILPSGFTSTPSYHIWQYKGPIMIEFNKLILMICTILRKQETLFWGWKTSRSQRSRNDFLNACEIWNTEGW